GGEGGEDPGEAGRGQPRPAGRSVAAGAGVPEGRRQGEGEAVAGEGRRGEAAGWRAVGGAADGGAVAEGGGRQRIGRWGERGRGGMVNPGGGGSNSASPIARRDSPGDRDGTAYGSGVRPPASTPRPV